jgi:hypothetical protein
MTKAGVDSVVGKGSDGAFHPVRPGLRRRGGTRRPATYALLLLLVSLWAGMVASACGSSGTAQAPAPLPQWIVKLVPGPGGSSGGVQAVEVQNALVAPDYVRLIVDGVDVTAYADKGPELLYYNALRGPVALEPGTHNAKVDRVNPTNGDGPDIVVDSYRWSFMIT